MLIGVALIMVGCTSQNNERERTQEELEMIEEMWRRARYARSLNFTSTIGVDYSLLLRRCVDGPIYDYVEILFAHNREEAKELLPDMSKWGIEPHDELFPPSTVVVWPREGWAQGTANGINWAVLRNEIDLGEFSLSDPVTPADLIDNWEKVDVLWRDMREQGQIMSTTRAEGADAFVLSLETLRLVGSQEMSNQVRDRGQEIGLGWRVSFELLLAIGSAEDFFAIANRIEEEGLAIESLSAEEILEKIEEEGN